MLKSATDFLCRELIISQNARLVIKGYLWRDQESQQLIPTLITQQRMTHEGDSLISITGALKEMIPFKMCFIAMIAFLSAKGDACTKKKNKRIARQITKIIRV